MRCCGFGGSGMLGAFADRMGALDSGSGFIVVFLIVLVVTAAWGDVSRALHLKPEPVVQAAPPEERL
ncbi:MAG: hypothetical protein U0103_08060 [Candidatus Obscuribacterales bacterium]|jgi:hypothetical protein|nr:MAG: hypothetical protein EKK48_19670 [Candidatus Melainabacteria bacterium]